MKLIRPFASLLVLAAIAGTAAAAPKPAPDGEEAA